MTPTLKASMAGAIALTFAAGLAFAQPAAGGGGGGRGAAFKEACGADVQKFCPNIGARPEIRTCMRKNYEQLSDNCKAMLAQMRSHGQGGQGQGGQGGGAPQ